MVGILLSTIYNIFLFFSRNMAFLRKNIAIVAYSNIDIMGFMDYHIYTKGHFAWLQKSCSLNA